MKGICHRRSKARHFSPSTPGDRYLNFGSKSDHRAEISANIVWYVYDALASRREVLSSWYLVCTGEGFLKLDLLPYALGRNVRAGSRKSSVSGIIIII